MRSDFALACAAYGVSPSEGIATATLVLSDAPIVKGMAELLYGPELVQKLNEGRIAPEGWIQ